MVDAERQRLGSDWRAVSKPPSAATPERTYADKTGTYAEGWTPPAVSAPDHDELVADLLEWCPNTVVRNRLVAYIDGLRDRLSAPAGEDAELCRLLNQRYADLGDTLTRKAAVRIEQLSAHLEQDPTLAAFAAMTDRAFAAELLAQQHGERIAELERLAADYYPFVEMLANNRPPRTIDLIDAAQMVKEHKRALAAQDTK